MPPIAEPTAGGSTSRLRPSMTAWRIRIIARWRNSKSSPHVTVSLAPDRDATRSFTIGRARCLWCAPPGRPVCKLSGISATTATRTIWTSSPIEFVERFARYAAAAITMLRREGDQSPRLLPDQRDVLLGLGRWEKWPDQPGAGAERQCLETPAGTRLDGRSREPSGK